MRKFIYHAPEAEEVQLCEEQGFMGPSTGIGAESVTDVDYRNKWGEWENEPNS